MGLPPVGRPSLPGPVLLQIFRLALNIKAVFGKSLDQGVVVCYLVVVGYLDPVDHPVGIHVLHAFN